MNWCQIWIPARIGRIPTQKNLRSERCILNEFSIWTGCFLTVLAIFWWGMVGLVWDVQGRRLAVRGSYLNSPSTPILYPPTSDSQISAPAKERSKQARLLFRILSSREKRYMTVAEISIHSLGGQDWKTQKNDKSCTTTGEINHFVKNSETCFSRDLSGFLLGKGRPFEHFSGL